jgi:hypothetical protein
LLPWLGEVLGVLPAPPVPPEALYVSEAPPPEPPDFPFKVVGPTPPPPPVDVMVLNTELEPLLPSVAVAVPPAPTVIV